jgi:hypothetical protein
MLRFRREEGAGELAQLRMAAARLRNFGRTIRQIELLQKWDGTPPGFNLRSDWGLVQIPCIKNVFAPPGL